MHTEQLPFSWISGIYCERLRHNWRKIGGTKGIRNNTSKRNNEYWELKQSWNVGRRLKCSQSCSSKSGKVASSKLDSWILRRNSLYTPKFHMVQLRSPLLTESITRAALIPQLSSVFFFYFCYYSPPSYIFYSHCFIKMHVVEKMF